MRPAFVRALTVASLLPVLAGCVGQRGAPSSSAVPAATPQRAALAPAPLVPDTVVQAAAGTGQDIQAGARIASQGGGGAVTACVGCHGASGEGNAQSNFPRLAAQGRLYLLHQLDSYADGSRKNPVMQPIAAAMRADQRRQAAAYYASLGSANPAAGAGSAAARPAPGREPVLAVRGDERRGLQSCANCHGPQGIGDAAANPYLAGQHPGYLTAALGEWKSGARSNDPSGQMPQIARALTGDEVRSLVAYYAAQTPPAPRNAQAAPPALPAGRAVVQSGPAAAASAPRQGVGTEQGAPLTGGAQGPGGAGGAAANPQQAPPQGR